MDQFHHLNLRSYGDGAYDTENCYKANHRNGSIPIIPPGRNSVFRPKAPDHWQQRNNAYLEILGLGDDEEARRLWKKLKNYHRKSLKIFSVVSVHSVVVIF